MKDDAVKEKILESAKAEFMEKGFIDASMRTIAERAGYTTGMLYSRFADKDEIFCALVEEGAEKLYQYFVMVQEEFASFAPKRQMEEMHEYTAQKVERMIDIMYEHFDALKLVICKSGGSSYERYVDRMVEVEMKHTERYISLLQDMGVNVGWVRRDLNHMLASALFNGIFEAVAHDLPKEDATEYIKEIQVFFNAGWDRIMGLG